MIRSLKNFIVIIFSCFVMCFSIFSASDASDENTITQIKIYGNNRIETPTILSYMDLKIGSRYSENLASKDIKKLYALSQFDSIDINFSKGMLEVKVTEPAFVSRVLFSGNYKVKSSVLSTELLTIAGEPIQQSRIDSDIEKIKEVYKHAGRFAIKVISKIEKQENNRVKVIFEISEGPKTGVKNIYFTGNRHYKDSDLKALILTKESRWFRFLDTNDTYDPARTEHDKHLLQEFYQSVGFADFRVISVNSQLSETKDGFVITYSLDEGQKYSFGDIILENKIKNIPNEDLQKFIKKLSGKTFNMNKVNIIIKNISSYLTNQGYPQLSVSPEVDINEDTRTAKVKIVIEEAEKIFINKINVDGNLKTEDKVIRRQVNIAEGDIFQRSKIEKAEQNIRNLDYFEKLSVDISPTKLRDKYDVNIRVEEKSTASINFDVGYNTSGGPFGRISFLERNLVGTGKTFGTGIQVGRKSTNYYLNLGEPYFLDKELSMNLSFFRNQNGKKSGFTSGGEQKYNMLSTGGTLSSGYNLTENLYHEVEYALKQDQLSSVSESSSKFILEQQGTFVTSAIGHNFTYDQIDSRGLPKNGYLATFSQEYAGVGGDVSYFKNDVGAKFFKSFNENQYTAKFSTSGGHIIGARGKKVRISDRFNLGGHSLRGFENGGIGPRDVATLEGLGGQKYYNLSLQLDFPVGLPKEFNVTGSVFADAGALWDVDSKAATTLGIHNKKAPRVSVGFGVLWVTRIAPINMYWGFPVVRQKYDDTRTFSIQFTTNL